MRRRSEPREGCLSARERVELLLDPGSFVEIDALVAHHCRAFGMASGKVPGDGVVSGYGTVGGRLVYLFAQDSSVFGGSLSEANGGKIRKVIDLALDNGAPVIGFYDSTGARLAEGIDALGSCGEIFQRQARASGVIPQLGVIAGACLGSAVFAAALSDFVFRVQGSRFELGDSEDPALAAPGGEDAGDPGASHFRPPNDAACLLAVRELLSYLPSNNLDPPPRGTSSDDPARREERLAELVPVDASKPYDIQELIQGVVDDRRFLEVQPTFARNLVVGFGRFANRPVGLVANQPAHLAGVLDIDASLKGARFVRFCDAFNLPLVTFVDIPGFLPGLRQEFGGIIKHGAKLIYAYAEATVPKVTLITRKAYGGGYAVMSSKHMRGDVNLAYPTAEIAVMGSGGAVGILYRHELRQAGRRAAEVYLRRLEEYQTKFSNPFDAAERGFIDAVIDPRETRSSIVRSLEQLAGKRLTNPPRKHGNLPL